MRTTPDLQRPESTARGSGVGASVGRIAKALLPWAIFGAFFFVDFPLCPMKHMLGIPCPGCGLTRATESLVTGDVGAALAFHPLVPLILPMVAWMVVRLTLVSAGLLSRDSFDPLNKLPKWFWVAFVVVMLGVWIARMAGGLGGHPDPVDPSQGFVGRVAIALGGLLGL